MGPNADATKKVISMSLCGDKPVYIVNAIVNSYIYRHIYPGWILRFYVDEKVPKNVIDTLIMNGCEIEYITGMNHLNDMQFIRFKVMYEKDVDYFVIRDADSLLGDKDYQATMEWIASGKTMHIMHDSPRHDGCMVLAGMWGAMPKKLQIDERFEDFAQRVDPHNKRRGLDQYYLMNVIGKKCVSDGDYIAHGAAPIAGAKFGLKTQDYPTHRDFILDQVNFIGEVLSQCFYCGAKFNKLVLQSPNKRCTMCYQTTIGPLMHKTLTTMFKKKIDSTYCCTKYILVKSVDGLGSNIATLVDAMYLADMTGRKIIVDWRDRMYGMNGENYFNRLFKNRWTADLPEIFNESMSFYPRIWTKKFNDTFKNVYREAPRTEKPSLVRFSLRMLQDKREDVIVMTNKLFIPDDILSLKMKRDYVRRFEPVNELKLRIDNFHPNVPIHPEVYSAVEKTRLIGVHYRHGNGELKNRRITDLYESYDEILKKLIKEDENSLIFLCTDSKEVEEYFEARYNCIKNNKLLLEKGEGCLHGNTKTGDLTAVGKDALLDMYMLSKCDYLVYPNGSWFSRMSYFLGDFDTSNTSQVNVIMR